MLLILRTPMSLIGGGAFSFAISARSWDSVSFSLAPSTFLGSEAMIALHVSFEASVAARNCLNAASFVINMNLLSGETAVS